MANGFWATAIPAGRAGLACAAAIGLFWAQTEAAVATDLPRATAGEAAVDVSNSRAGELRHIGMVKARTAALLMSGQSGGEITGGVTWCLEGAPADEPAPVIFYVEVDGPSLLTSHDQERLVVGLYGYVIDEGGRVVRSIAEASEVDLDVDRERLTASGLRLASRLSLGEGRYTLRLLLRNHQTDRYFLSQVGIIVPPRAGGEPVLLPPLFADSGSGWVEARSTQLVSSGASCAGQARDEMIAVRPVLRDGEPSTFHLAAAGWPERPKVDARIVDQIGRVVGSPELSLAGEVPGEGAAVYSATLTPVDLPPGRYRLIVEAGRDSGPPVLRSLPVVVTTEDTSWIATNVAGDPAHQDGKVSRRERLRGRRARQAYVRALNRLARGDEKGARRAVMQLERQALLAGRAMALSSLARQQMEVAEQLYRTDEQSLQPLVMLHHELQRAYTLRRFGPLAGHAARLTANLAELAHRDRPSPETAAFAAQILVSLAGYLMEESNSGRAEEMFERALQLEPLNETAMLGLAVLRERSGRYMETIAPLNKLVALNPNHSEARLRLGINLMRVGRQRQAQRHLRQVAAAAAQQWVRAVACQELAALLVTSGRSQEALTLLESATRQMPHNQRLQIQLAFVLDSGKRPWEAAEVVESLRAQHEVGAETPRYRYASWRPAGFDHSRRELLRGARERLAILAGSLVEAYPAAGTVEAEGRARLVRDAGRPWRSGPRRSAVTRLMKQPRNRPSASRVTRRTSSQTRTGQ